MWTKVKRERKVHYEHCSKHSHCHISRRYLRVVLAFGAWMASFSVHASRSCRSVSWNGKIRQEHSDRRIWEVSIVGSPRCRHWRRGGLHFPLRDDSSSRDSHCPRRAIHRRGWRKHVPGDLCNSRFHLFGTFSSGVMSREKQQEERTYGPAFKLFT